MSRGTNAREPGVSLQYLFALDNLGVDRQRNALVLSTKRTGVDQLTVVMTDVTADTSSLLNAHIHAELPCPAPACLDCTSTPPQTVHPALTAARDPHRGQSTPWL